MNGRLMIPWLVVWVACSGDDVAVPPPPPVNPVAPVNPTPPEPTESLVQAKKLAAAAKHEESLAMAEGLLAKSPDDDGLWRLVEQEAIAAGKASDLLDRLDATTPIGGMAAKHQALRATLALAAHRHSDALSAIDALSSVDPDVAAALRVRAELDAAGPLPTTATTPAEHLLLFVVGDASKAAANAAEAKQVKGWRAALLRAEVLASRGDRAGAFAEYDLAANDTDPRGQILGNLGRARLAAMPAPASAPTKKGAPAPATAVSDAQAAEWAATASDKANLEANGALAAEAVETAVGVYLRGSQSEAAYQLAQATFKMLTEASDTKDAARAGLALARAALASGRATEAREAAVAVRATFDQNGEKEKVADAAWVEAWAAHLLGRVDDIEATAELLDPTRKAAAMALRDLDVGLRAGVKLDVAGLAAGDAARLYIEGARLDPDRSTLLAKKAVDVARTANDPRLLVAALLELDTAERLSSVDPSSVEKELMELAPAGAAGNGLRTEVAARSLLAGGTLPFPSDPAGQSAVALAWRAATQPAVAPPPPSDTGVDRPIALWLAGRDLAAKAQLEQLFDEYAQAVAVLPVHRQGQLATGTVLDGSQGLPFQGDLTLLAALEGPGPVGAAFAMHDALRGLDLARDDLSLGRDFTSGLTDANRDALRNAVSRLRVEMLDHWMGTAPFPDEAFATLAQAEQAAAQEPVFRHVLPEPPKTVEQLTKSYGGAAVISYRFINGRVSAAVMTANSMPIKDLGPAGPIIELARKHVDGMAKSALSDTDKAAFDAGDKLRTALLDPFAFELVGVGRYMVIAPPELLGFPFATFPEQGQGLRYLADIRAISSAPTLLSAEHAADPPASFNPDYLAFASPGSSAVGDLPEEVEIVSKIFTSQFRTLLTGSDATAANYAEKAATARYIHIANTPASVDGGFQLADGDLTLAKIRATSIAPTVVVITAEAPANVQLARARAFLDAGASWVIIEEWRVPDAMLGSYLASFFEAASRDRTPSRALVEARTALVTDFGRVKGDDPGVWGSLVLVGKP